MKKTKTIQKKKYKIDGLAIDKEQAQLFGEQITTIINTEGGITPNRLIQEATPIDSIFHNYFEWNNEIAGKEYRLQQARDLINHVAEITVIEGEMIEHRSFFNVNDVEKKGKVYVTLKQVTENQDYQRQMIEKTQTAMTNCILLLKLLKEKL